MAYRAATGRKIKVEKRPKDVRAILRRHLREEGKTISQLADVWDMHVNSVYRRFYDSRPFPVQFVETAINFLKLDDFDANELRWHGAREAGWNINPDYLKLGARHESQP